MCFFEHIPGELADDCPDVLRSVHLIQLPNIPTHYLDSDKHGAVYSYRNVEDGENQRRGIVQWK